MLRQNPIALNEETGQACFAVSVACIAGCAWWLLHSKYFVEVYWDLVPLARAKGFVPPGFDGLFAALNLASAIVQSFSVGFLAALFAPRHPYRLAFVAMVLTFAAKPFCEILSFDFDFDPERPPGETWWINGLFIFIYSAGPLCGAFLAQAFTLFKSESEETLDLPAQTSPWSSFIAALGLSLVVSVFWKFFLVFFLMPFGRLTFLIVPLLQSASIGLCVTRCVPSRQSEYAVGAALLMYLFDVMLLLATTRSGMSKFLDFDILAVAFFCAVAAYYSAYIAE